MPNYIDPFRRMNADRRARLAQPTPAMPTGPSLLDGLGQLGGDRVGNDPRGDSRDHRSFAGLGDYFNDPDVQKNGRALMDMALGVANPAVQAISGNGMFSGQVGPQVPAFGINDAVADEIAQAAQGGGNAGGGFGVDLNAAGSVGESPGLYFDGGVVDEPLIPGDPPGPDNRIIGAKTGERVLTESAFKKLTKEQREAVERVMKEGRRK